MPSSRLLNAANTGPDGETCPAASVPGARCVRVVCGVGVRVGFGLGDGFGGATVRVRVVGSTVDEFEFCANATPAQETKIEAMTSRLFIISSSKKFGHRGTETWRF